MKTSIVGKSHFASGFEKMTRMCAGVMFVWLATANAAQTNFYTILHTFTGTNGILPWATVTVAGTTLYGTTRGSIVGGGSVFRVETDGSRFSVLKFFSRSEGSVWGSLLLSASDLYGMTAMGGANNVGSIFRIGTNGAHFTVLRSFSCPEACNPRGGLVLSGQTLYGATPGGGAAGGGTVFSMQTDGSGFRVLKEFSPSEGLGPRGSLWLSGGTLYGAAFQGGDSGNGTLFKINTDGTAFTILHQFEGTNGSAPLGDLIIADGVLYGTTGGGGLGYDPSYPGGGSGNGTVFRVNTDGTGYLAIKMFDGGLEGSAPASGLTLSGGTLYGCSVAGGISGLGTIFQVGTDGSGFTVLKDFRGSDGQYPHAGPVVSGTALYGTTLSGGPDGAGVVFRFGPPVPPTINQSPASQTAEQGARVRFTARTSGYPPPDCQWYFNETTALGGCTNSCLELSGLEAANSGSYTLVATNLGGAATSAPAQLNVIVPVPRRLVPALNLTSQSASDLYVEYKELLDTANWLPLTTVSPTGTSQFCFDAAAPLPAQRFYRVWQAGTGTLLPSLGLNFVPAISLSGNRGDSLRLEYINTVGATDAWITLDTVTLTNTPQLYFDVSSIGQPQRLYRILPVP